MAKKNNNVLLLNLESAELKCFYYRNSAFFLWAQNLKENINVY